MPRTSATKMATEKEDSGRAGASRPLAAAERAKLVQLEDVLDTAKRWQIEEAKALLEIRERKLWRGGYASFEEYGQRRWQIEHSRLYQLCSWGEVLRNLSTVVETYPERESHARPLYGLSADEQRRAWKAVCRRPPRHRTAADVETAVRALTRAARAGREGQPATAPATANRARAAGEVICADAADGVSVLDDGSVDLFLFSPPYCDQRKGHYPSVPEARYSDWLTAVMGAVRPKLSPQGSVLIVAREHVRGGQISDVWLRTRLAIRTSGWLEIDTLVWSKPDAPPLGRTDRPRRTFEFVYWFARTPDPYADVYACGPVDARAHLLRSRPRKSARVYGERRQRPFMAYRDGERSRTGDLIRAPVGSDRVVGVEHPAMYPVGLCDTLVRTFSPEGGLVADCFAGSGTTLVAARAAGRRWWGCDIVPRYVALARKRLSSSRA